MPVSEAKQLSGGVKIDTPRRMAKSHHYQH
jgi:hypothetical protein